jgi:hypothetical protein
VTTTELDGAVSVASPPPSSVTEALTLVMDGVRAVRKQQRNQQQNYNFRGIDAVMNAVGPLLREHGVVIVPDAESIDQESYQTKGGTAMLRTMVKMRYTIHGPDGSTITGSAYGEAADAGDKGIAKAQSVAYRVFLLQALTIPTDDADADDESHERSAAPVEATPQQRGFKSKQELTDQWDALVSRSAALPEAQAAELRAWVTKNKLTIGTITAPDAAMWMANIAEYESEPPAVDPEPDPTSGYE